MYVALELARSNAYYGAWALAADATDLPLAAATARVSATEAFHLASKENIQTHGGIGFTWAVDCHLFYRRSKQLGAGDRVGAVLERPPGRPARNPQRGLKETTIMDFNDTPEEAAFRAEARAFLSANAELKAGAKPGAASKRHRRRGSEALQGLAGEEGRRRFRRPHLAEALRRARSLADPAGDLQPGRRRLRRAARPVRDRPRHVHPDDDDLCQAGTTRPLRQAGAARRGSVVPAVQRTRRRLRPGGVAHPGGTRRRRLGHQRPEDLDLRRASVGFRHHRRAHRSERAET